MKKSVLKKTLKITAWVIGSIFALLLVLILTHPLWVGSVASCVAESTVTEMTKSDFTIDDLDECKISHVNSA